MRLVAMRLVGRRMWLVLWVLRKGAAGCAADCDENGLEECAMVELTFVSRSREQRPNTVLDGRAADQYRVGKSTKLVTFTNLLVKICQ